MQNHPTSLSDKKFNREDLEFQYPKIADSGTRQFVKKLTSKFLGIFIVGGIYWEKRKSKNKMKMKQDWLRLVKKCSFNVISQYMNTYGGVLKIHNK